MSFLAKIFGSRNDKLIKHISPLVERINHLEAKTSVLSDAELISYTVSYRERVSKGETLDQLLPEAFALCREAAKRALGQRHFDVQLLGGVVLHQGKISEMRTGEGKTLTGTLPCYLHSLTGKGAHVVTVNDYLARRDSEWMSAIYRKLGVTVGHIVHGLNDVQRQAAYRCDITYGTNNELGFDYLRDNMKTDPARLVQRGHYFAIVDEVDSILIDEARTPLIISGPADTNIEIYKKVNEVILGIQKDVDYIVDEKSRHVSLTEDGIAKMERRLRLQNLYDPLNIEFLHHIQQALKAHILFKKDVDYVVRDREIVIVDEFTGRLMPGRRYSDGLHGALEAKEHVPVQYETQTLASITFQNYFRLYQTLSGMTGTADTEAVEFNKIYGLDVVVIPTNRLISRIDDEDVIYRTAREKFHALAKEIEEVQGKGQPILVGTVSVEKSELLSSLLKKRDIPHEVLNAKNHAQEASIIAKAGEKGHVTIATNMAGRGTDIALGEGVREIGGLYVIGTERHESRRIDNQLRGRSGRQGDPGRSKFFLSFDDDLMRIFGSEKLYALMGRLGMEEGEVITAPMVTRAIEKAQRRVEEQHFSSRKNLIEYDDVMNQQRQVVYKKRNDALIYKARIDFFEEVARALIAQLLRRHAPEVTSSEQWDVSKVVHDLEAEFGRVSLGDFDIAQLDAQDSEQSMQDKIYNAVLAAYKKKVEPLGLENQNSLENFVYLQIIDQVWKEHLLAMDALKDSVSLRGYAQKDPLQEYKREAFKLFEHMMGRIQDETMMALLHMHPSENLEEEDEGHEMLAVEPTPILPQIKGQASTPSSDSPGAGGPGGELLYFGSRSTGLEHGGAKPTPFKRTSKVGRNDLCSCGSGKKYKKCHGVIVAE